MYGFECGTRKNTFGDAIAVVRHHKDDSFEVKRAWTIDTKTRTFVPVSPHAVFCETIE